MSQVKRKKDLDNRNGAKSMAFEVHSPVRLDQLDAEMVTAMGWRKSAALSAEGPLEEASVGDPAFVIVGHENPDANVLLSVIIAHAPDPDWVRKMDAVSEATIREVQAHSRVGATLSADEIQVALRHLLK